VAGYEAQDGSVDLYPRLLRNPIDDLEREYETWDTAGGIITMADVCRKAAKGRCRE
jgi:hypothetical protein